MRENKYQVHVIIRLRHEFPRCIVLKNDPEYIQGIPDLTVLYNNTWAMLEVKASARAPIQPNQEYYIEHLNKLSFAAFIYPENEEDVFRGLQQAFAQLTHGPRVPLAQ